MFTNKIAAFIVVASLLVGGTAMARKIKRIATYDTGLTVLWSDDGWGSDGQNQCSTVDVVALDASTDGGKTMLFLALSAYLSGKPIVGFAVHDNQCLAVGGWAAKLKGLSLQ